MFFAAVALAAIALSAASTPERLLKSNLYNKYDVQKLCLSARREKYLNQEVNVYENEVSPFGGLESLKVRSKVDECCTRPSTFEKKQCLKNVREYFLDTKCDKGLTHVCCQTAGPQTYFCLPKNPFTTLPYKVDQLETEEQLSYLENVEDLLTENVYKLYTEDALTTDKLVDDYEFDLVEDELKDELVDALKCKKYGDKCKCVNCNLCRRKLEKVTRLAAKKTCTKNLLKGGRDTVETCCEAGAVVGATVGKTHSKVCVPALYKFQTKVQGCGVNHKPQCKNAFVQCCKQAKRTSTTLGYDYETLTDLTTETYKDLVQYPFNY